MPRYYKLSQYLKERFGGGVQRVTLEAGMTCPNIDGSKSVGGCTFCTEDGSSSGAQAASDPIRKQLEGGIRKQSRRFGVDKFIAYFQSFTNTYAPVEDLRKLYDQAVDHPQVKVLAIGSRPDCVPDDVIELFGEYLDRGIDVWVDIGVQTAHNETLEQINRAHSFEDFQDACLRLNKFRKSRTGNPELGQLRICTHLIMGLPGETNEMMLETVKKVSESPIDDLKIHQLCVLEGTAMAVDYFNGELEGPFLAEETDDAYIKLLGEVIPLIPRNVVIQRLMAEAKPGELIAPLWAGHAKKQKFLSKLDKYLEENNLYQEKMLESSAVIT